MLHTRPCADVHTRIAPWGRPTFTTATSGSVDHPGSVTGDGADQAQDDPFHPARLTRYANTAAETAPESEADTDAGGAHSAVTSPPLSSSAIPGSRVTSPRSALSPVGRSIPLAQSQQQHQVPWWLRESRRDFTSAATVKAAIPMSPSQASTSALGRKGGRATPYAAGGLVSPPGPLALPAFSSTASRTRPKQDAPGPRFRSLPSHRAAPPVSPGTMGRQGPIHLSTRLSRRERALWTWMNVQDLDLFLQEVGGRNGGRFSRTVARLAGAQKASR